MYAYVRNNPAGGRDPLGLYVSNQDALQLLIAIANANDRLNQSVNSFLDAHSVAINRTLAIGGLAAAVVGAEGTGIVLGAVALEQTLRDPNSDAYSLTAGGFGLLPINPIWGSLVGIADLIRTDPGLQSPPQGPACTIGPAH